MSTRISRTIPQPEAWRTVTNKVVTPVKFLIYIPCSLAYGMKMQEDIMESDYKNKIYVMYDIASTMHKHVQVYTILSKRLRMVYYSLSIGQISSTVFTYVYQFV